MGVGCMCVFIQVCMCVFECVCVCGRYHGGCGTAATTTTSTTTTAATTTSTTTMTTTTTTTTFVSGQHVNDRVMFKDIYCFSFLILVKKYVVTRSCFIDVNGKFYLFVRERNLSWITSFVEGACASCAGTHNLVM